MPNQGRGPGMGRRCVAHLKEKRWWKGTGLATPLVSGAMVLVLSRQDLTAGICCCSQLLVLAIKAPCSSAFWPTKGSQVDGAGAVAPQCFALPLASQVSKPA